MTKKQQAIRRFEDDFPSVDQVRTPLDRALWALACHKHTITSPSHISHHDISRLLRKHDVSSSAISIARCLARAGDKVDREGTGKSVRFRIMRPGEDHLRRLKGGESVNVVYVDGSAAWTARRMLIDQIAKKVRDESLIVDKYVGVESLDLLGRFPKEKRIRFVTAEVSGNADRFQRELATFKREYKAIEIRKYPRGQELHDRYLLSGDELYLLGHGFKDFGKKESFLLVLKGPVGKEIRELLKKRFETRWAGSAPL